MLNYVKQRVRERGDLRGEVTIRGGDQVGHDGGDDMCWPVRSCLTLVEVPEASNGRTHYLDNMWIWFNAGLLPVAALLHTVCVSQPSLFGLLCGVQLVCFPPCALFFIRVRVEQQDSNCFQLKLCVIYELSSHYVLIVILL